MVLVLLSCGREPATGPMRTPGGVARGLSFNAIFPPMPNLAAFASVIDFNRVRVVLRHADGAIALDTLVAFPAGADAITLSFDVTLAAGTPAAGELLALNLAYLNAAGDTVFKGGPVQIRAAATIEGAPPPPPVSIPVVYSGAGASAKTIKISPRTLTVNAGQGFAFSAVASDSVGGIVAAAPVVWVTPDPTLATIPVSTVGAGTAKAARGTARIIAQLISGVSDTVTLNVIPAPTAVAVASGNSQSGVIGKPTVQALGQPIAVRVTAADGLGVGGVSVSFAAANGGTVNPVTVNTDAAGLAQTTWSLGTSATTQTATATVAGLTGSPVTFNATGAAKPATKLALVSGPAAGSDIPSGSPTPLVIVAQDADGDPVLGFTGNVVVALSANPAGGVLAGTTTVAAVGGTASFPAISIAKLGAGYVLQATSGTLLTPVSTNAFNIVTGPAANVALVSGGGQTVEAGAPLLPIKVLVTDVSGNPKSGVVVTFVPGAGFGTAAPTSVSTAPDGTATVSWTLGAPVGAQSLSASTTGVDPLVVSATAVAVVRKWVVTVQPPTSVVAGAAMAPATTAELRDAFDKVVPSFTGPTTIAIGTNPGGSTLGGTLTVNAVMGVATFAGLSLDKSGTGYTLVVTSSGATAASTNPFTVAPAGAASLSIVSGNAQTGAAGSALTQSVVAKLTDSFGNPVSATTVTVSVTAGGGSVTPVSGSTDAAGQLSTAWTLGTGAAAQTLSFAGAGISAVTATATATSAARMLVVTQQPGASQTAGVALSPVVAVEMRDGFNALVTSFTGPVAMAIGSNCCASSLAGTTTVNAVGGVASFPGLSLDKRGGGYTLVATSAGATSGTTNPFVVSAAAARFIAVTAGNGQSGTAGVALPTPLVAFITDNLGNGVPAATVAIRVRTGGGSVSPASASTDSTGRVNATWTLGSASVTQTLEFALSGIDSTTATATTSSGATTSWVITTQPAATQTAGATITPGVVAELRDGAGAVVTSFNGTTTLSLGSSPAGATLTGTSSVSAVSGIATFSSASLGKAGAYSLNVASSGATSVTSNALSVVAAAAAAIAVESGGSQTGTFGAMLGAPVVLKVVDAYGNPVAGQGVTFAVTSGGGSVGTPSATTSVGGQASTTWTLGSSGAQTISGTSSGLTGSPLTISAITASGSVARTVVSPRNDTLTSLGVTRALSAQARDVSDGIVAGSFTWTSRDASIATVSSGGVVTAVTNGATYIVASEIGGTRDSALIVVQQRTATVNVTPGSRSLYVTGTFTYSAIAVDGRGNAMATQPTFVWSSTSPTVASANASTGVVTALAIGTTQIRATAGSIIGVSPLSVLTPIKRILVSIDTGSVPATVPDTFTMTALGLRRAYRAIARDTLDNVMTGVTFTWASTNGSVAVVDSPTATTAGATSAANGITSIQASAQGVTGTATLYVAQVLASIQLSPDTARVDINGSTPLLARGKDSQSRYISGGSFTYTSSGPSFATVDAVTGVVTGKAYGTVNITATSGAITSNVAVVTISSTGVPAVLSFGRDTIGVGRGASVSVPILLSKPSASALVVTLSAADTNAYWSTSTITIPAGATSANATLNGRNAGTTRVSAIDATAVYASATSVVAVQANMRLTSTYYSLNQTDQTATQVLLSDPSPAGGTYVTFSYGTSGKAQVSPDPAFIPAGQLAADIVIRGIGAGSTTLTPLATGVSGTGATVTVAAAVLNIPYTTLRLGAGQFDPYQYVQVPNYLSVPLVVTLTNSDTSVTRTAPTVTIPASNYYAYFEVDGRAPGTSSVIASATGWIPDTVYVTTTTPRLTVCCSYTLNSSSPAQALSIYTTDSLGTPHPRVSSLSIRVVSSDTTVLKVLDTLATVTAGASSTSNARVIPNGTGGTAWIYVSAGGHSPDSVKFTVVGPALTFSSSAAAVGVGQFDPYQYITIPNAIAKPLVITLTTADSTIGATDATVTIPPGQYYAYLPVRGRGIGTGAIIATAVGYVPDTLSVQVSAPALRAIGSGTLTAYSTYGANVYTTDASGGVHNRISSLAISIRSSDPSVLSVDSAAVIPAGYYYVPSSVPLKALSAGTAKIYFTAPGHAPDSATFTVVPARVTLSFKNYEIGARQHQPSSVYVYIPNGRDVSVPVTLTHSSPTVVSLSTTSPTIPANTNYVYFDFAGLTNGVDTVIATASGYSPDTAYIRVSTPRFIIGSFPTTGTTTSPAASVLLYVADSSGTTHYANDTVVVHAVSSDSNVVKPVNEYFRVLKDSYYAYTGFQYVGPGTATITYSDSAASAYRPITSSPVTVTGPALSIGGSPGMLGTGQHTFPSTYYVSLPNSIGAPLTVNLVSTDPRVATVPSTVVVPAGQSYVYFTITAQDTIGTIQIQATATGYTASSTNMQVTPPKLVLNTPGSAFTTSPPNYMVVYAEDANSNIHPVNADLVVTLQTSSPGVAAIDSSVVTIVKDQYYSNTAKWTPGSVGTAQLTASDNRVIPFAASQSTANVTVNTPAASLGFSTTSLGIGQYFDTYVTLPNATTAPLDVLLTHAATPRTSTPASVTIPKSNYYQYFRITGTSAGMDTITASPPGHTPAVGMVSVDQGVLGNVSGWPTSLKAGDSTQVVIYLKSPDGGVGRAVASATTFALAADANATFTLGGASATSITSFVVPADGSYLQFYIKATSTGTANVTVSNANYVSYTNSFTVTP